MKNKEFTIKSDKYICNYCGKQYSKMGIGTHIWRKHGNGISHDPNIGYKSKNRKAWNRGLTKHEHDKLMSMSLKLKKRKGKLSHWYGRTHSVETKEKLSIITSLSNKGGRCKWYKVAGQSVQGTWEQKVAMKLEEFNIDWIKIVNKNMGFSYFKNRKHFYTPDFYLPEYGIYIEVKGFWWENDKLKMKLVLEQNRNLRDNLYLVEEELFNILIACNSKDDFMNSLFIIKPFKCGIEQLVAR